MKRRDVLKGVLVGATALCVSPRIRAQQAAVSVLDAAGCNVVVCQTSDGLVMVDCGPPSLAPTTAKVHTLFNTHYHLDQTGNNEKIGASGAKVLAHERTRQWMSTDFWIQAEDRYEKARPKAALPTETFLTAGSFKAGSEQIDYGYLIMAHTCGDLYVHFQTSNVIAVGDVASPVRDPALDYATGAWIGGRVDAMDAILKLADDQTRIIPAYGPVMTKAQFKAERDIMEELRARLFKQVREGDGPKDMLASGILKDLPRTWKDPEKFLYDAAKGLWAHHDKLDANVV